MEKKDVGKLFPAYQDENLSDEAFEIFVQQERCNC